MFVARVHNKNGSLLTLSSISPTLHIVIKDGKVFD